MFRYYWRRTVSNLPAAKSCRRNHVGDGIGFTESAYHLGRANDLEPPTPRCPVKRLDMTTLA